MFEKTTHSFVIKIWLEKPPEETDKVVWRGRIVHVATGERIFIKDYDEIMAFISPFVEHMDRGNHSN